ncbi:MAG: ABC transporter ATP-binding protein, partial [Planctomycetota bacterium]
MTSFDGISGQSPAPTAPAAPGAVPAVEVTDLEKTYVLGANAVPALRGVSLKVARGEFLAIMGPSGCGKTTLLNLIGLLDEPTRGSVRIDGQDVVSLSDDDRADLRCQKLGFVFQFYNLLPMLTASENVEIPLNFLRIEKEEREHRVEALLQRVGLMNRGHHLPAELSGGEQQRVTIARALANRPSIVLLDEPTGDLDSKTGAEIMDLVFRLNQEEKTTFIMVTHDPAMAERADRLLVVSDGQILEERIFAAGKVPARKSGRRPAGKSTRRKATAGKKNSKRAQAKKTSRRAPAKKTS